MKFSDRNPFIDFLRGIAILLVLLLHFQLAYHLGTAMDILAGNGNYGVTMFFVISGFLITSISLKRYQTFSEINPFEFYAFRFARIFPCLLLALSIITIFNLFKFSIFQNSHSVSFVESILSVLMFWHNILMQKYGYFNYCLNIYWSLSVEEVFYLAFPLIAIFLKKTKYIIPFWILLIFLAPLYRSQHTTNDIISLYSNLSCFDAISIGCLCAILADQVKLPSFITLIAAATMLYVYFAKGIMENIVLGPSLIALSTGIMLLQSKKNASYALFRYTKLINWFGQHSYEIYLFHIILLGILRSVFPANLLNSYEKIFLLFVFLIGAALSSSLISKFFSEPMNKYLRNNLVKPIKTEYKMTATCGHLQNFKFCKNNKISS